MKKVLFVCMGMGFGGTEKTLVSALNVLDFTKYDVTLYIRKKRTDLLADINKSVKVIVNDDAPAFENSIYCKMCSLVERVSDILGLKIFSKKFSKLSRKYVLNKRRKYEKNTFFSDKTFDYAIAYDMAFECAKFVLDDVVAKQKITFFHASRLHEAKMQLYKHFDKIVCVNQIVASDMKDEYPQISDKVLDIENYISPNYVFNFLKKDEPVLRPNNKIVLCSCGRIAKVKGFDLAVSAASILKSKGIDFHWYFVGNYLDDGVVKELIKNENLQNEITVTGFVENPYRYMNMCDVYIQPSWEDAHATTVVETAILCKPIISTDTSTGRLFSDKYKCCKVCQKSGESIAEAILYLYNNPLEIVQLTDTEKAIDYSEKLKEYTQKINGLFID